MEIILIGLVLIGIIKILEVCVNEIKEKRITKRNEKRKFNQINY